MPKRRYTIATDFDGVIHSFQTPWISPHVIVDLPVPGAIEWLNAIVRDFDVVILTTRAATAAGCDAVWEWLIENGYTGPRLRVTAQKPPALVYIDDRGWRFEGVFPSAEDVYRARPWHKRMSA